MQIGINQSMGGKRRIQFCVTRPKQPAIDSSIITLWAGVWSAGWYCQGT
jgi:hypothetical protein